MSELRFRPDKEGRLMLPEQCGIAASCYETEEARQAVAAAMEQIIYALALVGMDLRALDGITLSHDCRADATASFSGPDSHSANLSNLPRTVSGIVRELPNE